MVAGSVEKESGNPSANTWISTYSLSTSYEVVEGLVEIVEIVEREQGENILTFFIIASLILSYIKAGTVENKLLLTRI